ncbi:MAG: chemotaxis protein CheW [Syntrophomonadaceae bacterium]|jgi:purine-binding chemotaxis protein CheW
MADGEMQTVAFVLGQEEYGMEISKVQEIIRVPEKTTKLPNTSDYNLGVTNLRGSVIPVIDLKRKFMNIPSEFTDETRVIVVEIGSGKVGLVVDEVLEVIKFPENIIAPTTVVNTGLQADYLLGIAKLQERLLILLDVDKIFN